VAPEVVVEEPEVREEGAVAVDPVPPPHAARRPAARIVAASGTAPERIAFNSTFLPCLAFAN